MTMGTAIWISGIIVAVLAVILTIIWCAVGKKQKTRIKAYLKEWY